MLINGSKITTFNEKKNCLEKCGFALTLYIEVSHVKFKF